MRPGRVRTKDIKTAWFDKFAGSKFGRFCKAKAHAVRGPGWPETIRPGEPI